MNIYDVLRRIVEARPFQPWEQQTALQLLDQAEQLNLFGTTARYLDPETHKCERAGPLWPDSGRCLLCQAPMLPVPPHQCAAVRSWAVRGYHNFCRYCGADMGGSI